METKKTTQVDGCNTCKKGLSNTQKSMVALGFYILLTSIYGTVHLFKLLYNLF